MEAMLGIALHSYPFLNLQKRFVFLIVSCLLFNKIRDKGKTGSDKKLALCKGMGGGGGQEGEMFKYCMHM
jgi:hypothetical protein